MAKNETKTGDASESTALTEAQKKELAEFSAAMLNEAGAGFEDATSDSYAIPFLQVLQSGSPQCKKSDGKYIRGAEEGMLFNTVTMDITDGEKGVLVIPCHFTQRHNEWKPRDAGGGFVAEHSPNSGLMESTVQDEKNNNVLSNGNHLVDTRNHYVLIVNEEDGSVMPAMMSMSGSQTKVSRQWMSKMQGIKMTGPDGKLVTAPMCSRMYRITTAARNNDKGSWFVFNPVMEGVVTNRAQFDAAIEFRNAVRNGTARTEYASEEGDRPSQSPNPNGSDNVGGGEDKF